MRPQSPLDSPAMKLFSRIKARPHLCLLALLILLAMALRCFDLSGLPMGLHGDEGIVGYEARRIVREGSIGPYSPASFGQPAGPIYFSALGVALNGDEILSIRAWSALFGVFTVLALWGVMRASLGANAALLSAFLLATLCWHLHYSRIAFPLVAWPLMCVLIVGATRQAMVAKRARWWLLAGFANGLAVYAYKAHPLFGLIALSIAAWVMLRADAPIARRLSWLGLYSVSALLAANFLIRYALDPANGYGGQFALTSIFNQPAWQQLQTWPQQMGFLAARYFGWWDGMTLHPMIDYTDGAGVMPLISPVFMALSLWGLVAWKRREPLVQWSRWIVVLMPLAAVVTNDGLARRTFALAPFLCVLSAVGAVELVRWSRRFAAKRALAPRLMTAVVGVLVATHAALSCYAYFVTFARSPAQAWIFCDELTTALAYMRSLPHDRPIYFYSSRWSISYDTRKFLAPDLNARDASAEFADDHKLLWPPPTEDRAVWVLLDSYKARAPELQQFFPNAQLRAGAPSLAANGEPAFLVLEN